MESQLGISLPPSSLRCIRVGDVGVEVKHLMHQGWGAVVELPPLDLLPPIRLHLEVRVR